MTIEEAIEHCNEKAKGCTDCAREHHQLAEWLTELLMYRQGATDQRKIDVDKACEWLRTSEIANFSELQIKYFKEAMMEE